MNDYHVRDYTDIYRIYELSEQSSGSSVKICPERGGIAISLVIGGRELFYLDRGTFADPEANIRGGNPILFPISGQLPDKRYEWEGTSYLLNNHGFARNKPWEVVASSTDDEASLTLLLTSDAETLAAYPFEFELRFTYRLKDGKLRIDQEYRNLSDRPMPMYPGFHPYFQASAKALSYDTNATRYRDYNDHATKPITGPVDLDGLVESVTLLDAKRPCIGFEPQPGLHVRMIYSDLFKYIVLWSVQDKPFVCVEPWMAKTEELIAQQELVMVPPSEAQHAFLTIALDQPQE